MKPLDKVLEILEDKLGHVFLHTMVRLGEITLTLKPGNLQRVFACLRDDPSFYFRQLIDITAVDYPGREKRFEVVYHLLSMKLNQRLRVKIPLGEGESLESLIPLFQGANWWEREVWDMFGITFTGHPDLRRLLSDYAFEGHPLRKDFPLSGYVEVAYDEGEKKVTSRPVNLKQAYRDFDYLSPWEGPQKPLPGDEKAVSSSFNPSNRGEG